MSDPTVTAAQDAQEADDAMPTGDARRRAEEELATLAPGPAEPLHFDTNTDAERSIDEPMHDFIGRSDGP